MNSRSNEEWIAALQGEDGVVKDSALRDLYLHLFRGLGHALANRSELLTSDIEDFAQDAVLRVVDKIETFRGESKFTTWAQKIGVRLALTELRRRRWQDVSLDQMVEKMDGNAPRVLADPSVSPEKQMIQATMMEMVGRVMAEKLTERQRQAITAVRVNDVPLEEVAQRMGMKRNALYKMLHDARTKLQKELTASGMSPQEILAAFAD